MWYKLSPMVKVWLSNGEIEVLHIMSESPEHTISRSSMKQEHFAAISLLVSKSVVWRKKIHEDVIYGKKRK